MNQFGHNFRLAIWGESHGHQIGISLDGVPAGIPLSEEDFAEDLARRRSGAPGTTPRREPDVPQIVSGVYDGYTTGAPLTIEFANTNTHSQDYSTVMRHYRPSHADLVAYHKFNGFNDPRGGGHFLDRARLAAREDGDRQQRGDQNEQGCQQKDTQHLFGQRGDRRLLHRDDHDAQPAAVIVEHGNGRGHALVAVERRDGFVQLGLLALKQRVDGVGIQPLAEMLAVAALHADADDALAVADDNVVVGRARRHGEIRPELPAVEIGRGIRLHQLRHGLRRVVERLLLMILRVAVEQIQKRQTDHQNRRDQQTEDHGKLSAIGGFHFSLTSNL